MITAGAPRIVAADVVDALVAAGAVLVVGVVVGAWLLGALWAFRDSARRSDSLLSRYLAATWILLSGPFFLPLAAGVYGLIRPADSAADRARQRLAATLRVRDAAAETCLTCRARIDPRWLRCPTCATWLAARCAHCERWAPRDAEICPWCAWDPGLAGSVTTSPAQPSGSRLARQTTGTPPVRPAGLRPDRSLRVPARP